MALSRTEKKYYLNRMNGTARKTGLGDMLIDAPTVPVLASAPSAPVAGELYFNSGDSKLYLYTGSAWVSVSLA